MNFTREPIIETIVAPRDGYRLLIRNSKHRTGDEFLVDAVEMVSFGAELFFRNLEKPKPFLLPVSDYEVLEVKETRLAIKNVQMEKRIKIRGGREGSPQPKEEGSGEEVGGAIEEKPSSENRRKRKGRRHDGEKKERAQEVIAEEAKPREEFQKGSSSKGVVLVPPPSNLVSEKLSRVREEEHKNQDLPIDPPTEDTGEAFPYQRSAMTSPSTPSYFTGIYGTEDPPIS
jgi:hypothetical protein